MLNSHAILNVVSTVAELNTVHCREDACVNTNLFKPVHKLTKWFRCSSHLLSMAFKFCFDFKCVDNLELCRFWCCCLDIFQRTRITLFASGQLICYPSPASGSQFALKLPAPVNIQDIYSILICCAWDGPCWMKTTQRVFSAYLNFWISLKLNWNV